MTTDPLRSRIFNELRIHYETQGKEFINMTAKNLAFLVRHHLGPEIEPTKVSLPIVDIYEDGATVAHRAALVVHGAPGKHRVLIQNQSPVGHTNCLVHELSDMAEKAIVGILGEDTLRPVFDIKGSMDF
ncbi:hypothetical protein BU26DRAFT_506635 [Trematosphaeria pertusa]|uniref:Uncharacterized protein n=1 Tax=Trematosphaeria pertusa TaxID=390896 RepID=A0A6A6ID06_9PLEO|nr:uncharacterized protein BU26DRAFT_506635 [Trematosphaeria pertusa]KAF2247383.1 hypothetical protein BU26DRAFT_506635 [Trematosphaeria pertusa]